MFWHGSASGSARLSLALNGTGSTRFCTVRARVVAGGGCGGFGDQCEDSFLSGNGARHGKRCVPRGSKMNWEQIDWSALERLRNAFLEGSAGKQDYWRSASDLASYDETFAQRIGWKWDYVLNELTRRG